MSTHALLNLLIKLRNSNKMLGLLSILLRFCNEFNKFNNTRAQNEIFYLSYDVNIFLQSCFWCENV